MKKYAIKLENNGIIINATILAFTAKGAIKKAYRKYGR